MFAKDGITQIDVVSQTFTDFFLEKGSGEACHNIVVKFFDDKYKLKLAIGTSYDFSERGFDNETCNSTGVYNNNITFKKCVYCTL